MIVIALRSHECDIVVAKRNNVIIEFDMSFDFNRDSFLSFIESCKIFDNDVDDYCREKKVEIVILKRLNDALVEKDNIQNIIKSIAINHATFVNSITYFHVEIQQSLMRQVFREAHLKVDDIEYVEMHEIDTQVENATKFVFVTNVFNDN